jgi:hypothetical protein
MVGAHGACPISGAKSCAIGEAAIPQDALAIETIVLLTYEMININQWVLF